MIKKESILGGALLISSSCIGAGILVLPVICGMAGFLPSLFMFLISFAFMTMTGLLVLEANHRFSMHVNFVSMVGHSLGRVGRMASGFLYVLLFYTLLVAYITMSGTFFVGFFKVYFGITLQKWYFNIPYVLIFGSIVYQGTRKVDSLDRIFSLIKIVGFVGFVVFSFKYIRPERFLHWNSKYAFLSLPILITSFGFHNMIPKLMSYMKGDVKRAKKSIILGSSLTLIVYLLLVFLVLGMVPIGGTLGIGDTFLNNYESSEMLTVAVGRSPLVFFIQIFAFFAILSSFEAQTLTLVHFLSDWVGLKNKDKENIWICLISLAPALVISILYPNIFYEALGFAGGILTVILFGFFPVCMAWVGRYKDGGSFDHLAGEKPLLFTIIMFVFVVLGIQFFKLV